MNCPYCFENKYTRSYLPPTNFNHKVFNYLQCKSCNVIFIAPFPNDDDLKIMYSPEYQEGVNKEIKSNLYEELDGLRFSYGKQFDLIEKHCKNAKSVVDYGCGSGNFIVNAINKNYLCIGVEYNPLQVNILKQQISSAKFYTISDFESNKNEKYDVIRLSNVLEHLENPNQVILSLVERLSPNGIIMVEGPIESNRSFAFFLRKIYFVLKGKLSPQYVVDHAPTHLTFTNYNNQKSFFERNNLVTLEYIVKESAWPFPTSFSNSEGLGGKIKYLIAKTSILLGKFIPNYGNTFIYVGRKK